MHFCLERWLIVQLWTNLVAPPLHYPRCKAYNYWLYVDAHTQNVAAMLSQPFVPRKASDSKILGVFHRTAVGLSKMQGQKWLMLNWRSCWGYSIDIRFSLLILSLYTTSQICVQCLTDLIFLLVALQSTFKNHHSALLKGYFWQSFELEYPAL